MSTDSPNNRLFARYPAAATALYAALIVGFAAVVWISLADLLAQRSALASSVDLLEQLEAHRGSPDAANAAPGAVPSGSPFLGGETITVAGAELLQRVAGAITRFGGSVQSSQVDLQGTQAKADFVTLIVSCEIDEANLQKLLYDIEAGMPYLFVDQLTAQAPQAAAAVANGARMSVLLAVSGRWSGKK
jgi:general secretion pathway protein M